ncbi:PREDICTED: zinc finger protein 62 homolog [Drosophila arizonae]|uniref:Zinc finger protein 62 homolog n=1 Tax=Drosophila arizonae TaxID=7263 RepID=A0ABM1PLG0_DROAR|nr:PREDICTED: zinc finger protein 62 homolog [Drosophila arizonae]
MSICCRTCAEPIFHLNPRNLFKEENEDIRQNIQAITGIRLSYDPQMPTHICSCCYLDLDHAIAFRERCLDANKQLISLKQDEIVPSKNASVESKYIDPLDNRAKDAIKFKNRLINSPGYKELSRNECKQKNEDVRRVLSPRHSSPRVRLLRCRNPNNGRQIINRPGILVSNSSPKNGLQSVATPHLSSDDLALAVVRPTASIAPSPTKRFRSVQDKKYAPASRHDKATKVKKKKPKEMSLEKKYVCEHCGWSFRDLSNMKDHALRHSGVKKFECEECCRKFFTRPLLKLHIRVHHKGEKPFVCKYCGMAFRNSPSRCRHERKYHPNELPFECDICDQTFISKISLDKHKEVHVKGETTHRCETCNKNFKGSTYLRNHYLTKLHQRRMAEFGRRDYPDAEMGEVSDEDIGFDLPDSIIEELDESDMKDTDDNESSDTTALGSPSKCAKNPSNSMSDINEFSDFEETELFQEVALDKVASSPSSPVVSSALPSQPAQDKDSMVGKRQYRKSKVNNVKPPANPKVFICDLCGHQSSSPKNLDIHILRHKGEKNFECAECGIKHYSKYLLQLHIRVKHQGEMPYLCKFCDQRFYSASTRQRHEQMSKMVLCRTCGEQIYSLNAKNLFHQENEDLLHKIDILTGIRLNDEEEMPKLICTCCYLDLNHSIAFRERCIKIQIVLRDSIRRDTSAIDPLYSAKKRGVSTAINIRKQPERKIVRARIEAKQTSSQVQAVRARSPKQASSTNTTSITDSAHHRQRIMLARVRSETECDKSINSTRLRKASVVAKNKCIEMDETMQSAAEDSDSATSDRSRNQVNRKVKQREASKTYVCDQCGRCFTDASNLKVHILRHTGVKNFECPECDSKYFTRHLLNLHIRVRHQGEMPYACKYCDQRFFTSTTRCRHERVKHTRKLTYACRVCGKTYLTKSCLNKHEFLHTGERPYRCDICNVGFPRKTNLKIHYRSKQHQTRANVALDNASSDGETETDSISKDFDV